jgi:predicted Zn-dependent peptidase
MSDFKPHVVRLSNGLRFVYLHAPSPVAHLGLTFLAGSRYESASESGLAHYLEHCIFKGTTKRKSFHVLSRLDSVGGELNAFTSKEEMCLYSSFTKNHLDRAAELLADISMNANFPAKEIEKEKEIVLDEINSYLDSPADKIFDDFEAHLFKNHPLGENILGTKESVSGFTRQHLIDFKERHFHIDNTVISFVGDIPLNKCVKYLEKHFENFPKREEKTEPVPFEGEHLFNITEQEANYQAHALIGGYATGYEADDRRTMQLLINLLGGPALNSRLNLSIREKYGYTYNIEASYTPYKEIGYWNIYLGTDQKYLKKTMSLVYKELKKLIEQPLGERQLLMAKEQYKGQLALGMESNSGMMIGLGKSILLFNEIDTIENIYASLDEITSEEIQELSKKIFSPESLAKLVFELKSEE